MTPNQEPKVKLNGDLPPIGSDEFKDFLHQWHADHNGNGKKHKNTKQGQWERVDIRKP